MSGIADAAGRLRDGSRAETSARKDAPERDESRSYSLRCSALDRTLPGTRSPQLPVAFSATLYFLSHSPLALVPVKRRIAGASWPAGRPRAEVRTLGNMDGQTSRIEPSGRTRRRRPGRRAFRRPAGRRRPVGHRRRLSSPEGHAPTGPSSSSRAARRSAAPGTCSAIPASARTATCTPWATPSAVARGQGDRRRAVDPALCQRDRRRDTASTGISASATR